MDVVGYQVKPDILETLREDLDFCKIGTLIVMGANDAAYNIYSWGSFTKDYEDSIAVTYISLQLKATQDTSEKKLCGEKYRDASRNSLPLIGDKLTRDVILSMEIVSAATPNQQRIVAEASIVAIVLHVHAIDSMYLLINLCDYLNPNLAW